MTTEVTKKSELKKTLIAIAIGALTAIGLVAILFYTFIESTTDTASYATLAGKPMPVQTTLAKESQLKPTYGATGQLKAWQLITLSSSIPNKVIDVNVEEGDFVQKGQILVQFDKRKLETSLSSKIAEVKSLEGNLRLQRKLLDSKLISETNYAIAEASLQKRSAELESLQIDLADTTIKAPISGIIYNRKADPQEFVLNGAGIIDLAQVDKMIFESAFSDETVGLIELGQKTELSIYAFPERVFEGTVLRIAKQSNTSTRTYSILIEVENPNYLLQKGLSGFARITMPPTSGIVIPTVAIINPTGNSPAVFIVDEKEVVSYRTIRTGLTYRGETIVLEGLKEGDRIVTVGQLNLEEGTQIKVY